MPRVSVFMSSYNHAGYLRVAIESVLRQTFDDLELFIVDDASTDDSWEIIQGCSDPRLHAVRNPANRNDKQELNRFIRELAAGEFIAVHHSDNIWEPDKLRRQVELLDTHPEVGAVFTNAQVIDEHGAPFQDQKHFYFRVFEQPNRSRQAWLNHFFYHGNVLCHPSVLIRRKCYDECGYYRLGLAQIPDLDLWVRLCMQYEIHVLPEKLVRFRVQSDESHSSGNRPATRARGQFEYLHVMDHYGTIAAFDELATIFPEAERYRRATGEDLGYVLGRIALGTPGALPAHQLFGLNLLFAVISNPQRAARVAELYGFTHKDFIELAAAQDIFSLEGRRVGSATTQKPAAFPVRARNALFPVGSFQHRVLQPVYRLIRSRIRSR